MKKPQTKLLQGEHGAVAVYAALVLVRTRNEALYRDRNRRWVRELFESNKI